MKRTWIFFFLLLIVTSLSAKPKNIYRLRVAYKKKQYAFGLGPGFGCMIYPNGNDYLMYGTVTSDNSFPITFTAEYAYNSFIGIGVFYNHYTSQIEVTDNTDPQNKNGFDYKSNTIIVRGSYHLYLGHSYFWLDPYAAAGIGFQALSNRPFGDNNIFEPNKSSFAWQVVGGFNIYPMQNIGVFVEAGFGVNIAQTGLILRF